MTANDPLVSNEDRILWAAANACPEYRCLTDLSTELLARIAADRGIDFATALLFDRLRRSPLNEEFIATIEASDGSGSTGQVPADVVIMPGAFYQHHSHTGADGKQIMDIVRQLGWNGHRVPVRSLAPMEENAEVLSRFLKSLAANRILIVSLSKGGADVRAMLARNDATESLRNVVGWISFSGMTTGTPLVKWLHDRPIRYLGAKLLLLVRGQSFAPIRELRREAFADRWPSIPQHIKVIHIAGFPLSRNLSHPWAHRGYDRLANLGPNDGGGILLGDLIQTPGYVYPVWAADHYLQPRRDLHPLLVRIFREAVSA